MNMNHDLTGAIGLHRVAELRMAFGNEAIFSPMESEKSIAFQRDVLKVLTDCEFSAADLQKPTIGDGIWTVFQYLRGSEEVPWNVLVLLRDWSTRYQTTGYDFVAAWSDAQEFQAG